MRISLAELLTIVFIVLKLTGFINWSWVLVLSPFIINVLFHIAIYCKAKNDFNKERKEKHEKFNALIERMRNKN